VKRSTKPSVGLVGLWHAMVSESRILAAGRRFVPKRQPAEGFALQPSPPFRPPRSVEPVALQPLLASSDEALISIADRSLPIRTVSRAGEHVVSAWRESIAATVMSRWAVLPLDRRVRFAAIVLAVGALTHISLTGFSAPDPTPMARATWTVVVLILVTIGANARGVAAAWAEWKTRRAMQRDQAG
jgi:hypothetical protein